MTLRAILREALAQRLARGETRTFAKAEMRGLPMDEASRMARAREQGFDVETPVYHGTHTAHSGDFAAFDPTINPPPSKWGMYGTGGTYAATHPDWANNFASVLSLEPRVMPLYARAGKVFNVHGPRQEVENTYRRLYEAAGKDPSEAIAWLRRGEPTQAYRVALSDVGSFGDAGFDAVRGASEMVGDEVMVFNANNLRSRFAAFDPHNTNRANLLGGFAVGAPIGALTLREALRERAQA